jgi:hypothetical protein
MKTYILFLDFIIVCLLVLAIHFHISDNVIHSTSRRGVVGTMIISWQSLLGVSTFCVMLRYIIRNVRVHA